MKVFKIKAGDYLKTVNNDYVAFKKQDLQNFLDDHCMFDSEKIEILLDIIE